MASFSEVMKTLIKKHGDNKSQIAKKLGLKDNGKPIYSSQLLGQYERGESVAKAPFYRRWKEVFKDDIESLIERNISSESHAPPTDPMIVPLELWEELRINNKQFRMTREDDVQEKNKLFKQNGDLIEQNGKLIDIFHDLTRRGIIPHKS